MKSLPGSPIEADAPAARGRVEPNVLIGSRGVFPSETPPPAADHSFFLSLPIAPSAPSASLPPELVLTRGWWYQVRSLRRWQRLNAKTSVLLPLLPYARPKSMKEWVAVQEALASAKRSVGRWNKIYFSSTLGLAGLSLVVCAVAISTGWGSLLAFGLLSFAVGVVAIGVASEGADLGSKLSYVLSAAAETIAPADPEKSLARVQSLLSGHSNGRASWDTLLDHSTVTGVPVLNGDVQDLVEQAKKGSDVWR